MESGIKQIVADRAVGMGRRAAANTIPYASASQALPCRSCGSLQNTAKPMPRERLRQRLASRLKCFDRLFYEFTEFGKHRVGVISVGLNPESGMIPRLSIDRLSCNRPGVTASAGKYTPVPFCGNRSSAEEPAGGAAGWPPLLYAGGHAETLLASGYSEALNST